MYGVRIGASALMASVLLVAGCAAGQQTGDPSATNASAAETATSTTRQRRSPTPGPVVTPAAAPDGWRYAYISERPGSRITGITTAGPQEAWAAGAVDGRLLLLRHDGTAWREAEPPPGPPVVPSAGEVWIAASGPDDVWLLLPEVVPGEKHHRALMAVRWDGSAWHQIPGRIESPGVAAFKVLGPADAWAVLGPGEQEALRWDGRSWTKVPLPANATALDGSRATGLWAVGFRTSGEGVTATEEAQPAAMRWDGGSWRLVRTPTYAFPSPKPPEGTASLESVLVLGRDDVWASGTHTFNHGEVENEPADPPPILLHWDGRSWTRQDASGDRDYCCPLLAAGPSGSALVVSGSPRLRESWRLASPGASPVKLPSLPKVPGLKRSQFFKVAGTARTGMTWAAGTLSADGGFWSRAAIAALS